MALANRTISQASGGLSTPRSPGNPRLSSADKPLSSPSSNRPRNQIEAGRSGLQRKQLYLPEHQRLPSVSPPLATASELQRVSSASVLRAIAPNTPTSPPFSGAFDPQHALTQSSRPSSSASPHARSPAGQRSLTASLRPSARETADEPAARPKRRISLHLPAECRPQPQEQRTECQVVAPSQHVLAATRAEPCPSVPIGAERFLRDVLDRLEERPSPAVSGVGTMTLGRVRKTFLRGKTASQLVPVPPGRSELEAASALDRERVAQESEREVARWADGGNEVPQAVLFAEQERLSPLGDAYTVYGNGVKADDLRDGGALRERPSQGRMVSSPAALGARTPTGQHAPFPLSPSAGLRATPLPTAYAAQHSAATDSADHGWSSKKRTHSSASSVASSINQPAGGSIATMTSIRSEALPLSSTTAAWARRQQQQPQQPGTTLRVLTTPAAPSLAQSLAAPDSPVFARPTLPASRATEHGLSSSRSVSQPPLLQRRTTAPPSPGQSMAAGSPGVDEIVCPPARREPSFDLDRCVARVQDCGDGYVSFASIGVGQPQDEELIASSTPDEPKRGWWTWLGGATVTSEPHSSTASAA